MARGIAPTRVGRTASVAAGIAALVLCTSADAGVSGFWLTGNAPNAKQGAVTSLSQNGSMAAGESGAISPYAPGFTWTANSGRQDLIGPGLPPGTPLYGMSSDGGTLAGYTIDDQQTQRAYRRVGSGPLQDLGTLSGETRSYAWGVSGDGSVVVGHAEHTTMTRAYGQAFRWTQGTGMQPLGYLKPDGTYSQANAISRDGATIVGVSQSGGPFGGPTEAFTWTQAGGMKGLPVIPGAASFSTYAQAVSESGSVIVGSGAGANGRSHAVRWMNGSIEDLTPGFEQFNSVAYAVSDAGDVIGGAYGNTTNAFVWTPSTSMVLLSDYLTSHGVTVPSGYRLEYVYAISGDGMTFGGEARNLSTNVREGFVATIPSPASLLGLTLAPFICSRRRRG